MTPESPIVAIPVQTGHTKQNGLGVGNIGDPMFTLDCTGAAAVVYSEPMATWWDGGTVADALTVTSDAQRMPDKNRLQAVVQHTGGVLIPCNIDGAQVVPTLRGFGHGWQGQHNTTNAVAVWEYDGYNQKLDDSGVHRTLRIGRDSSDFVAYPESILFEPMSLREENWVERDTKNALRAEASKSSHAVVNQPTPTPLEEPVDTPNNLVVRRLTPLECELLMGWNPNWTAEGVEEDGKVVKMADTHRYRMCGNGVVANVGEWIAVRYVAAKTAAEETDR